MFLTVLGWFCVCFGIFFLCSMFEIKTISFTYDTPEFEDLRRKYPVLDMKGALRDGLIQVQENFNRLTKKKELYESLILLSGKAKETKEIIVLSIISSHNIVTVFKKSDNWWRRQYRKNGYNKSKTLHNLIDKDVEMLKHFKTILNALEATEKKLFLQGAIPQEYYDRIGIANPTSSSCPDCSDNC